VQRPVTTFYIENHNMSFFIFQDGITVLAKQHDKTSTVTSEMRHA